MARKKNKRGKRARPARRKSKGLKTYSYKRLGNALGDEGRINMGDLTAHTSALTFINPQYEIANNGLQSQVDAFKYLQNHSLDQMIGLNDFITFNVPPATGTIRQLYGLYRINGIRIKLIPNLTSLDQEHGVNRPTQITVVSVKDPADLLNGTSSEGRVNQFQSVKSRKLIWDGKSTMSYYFKPKVHTVVKGAVLEGTSVKSSPWLKLDQTGVAVPHFGDKIFFKSTATFITQLTNNFRIEKTFYVSFKQVM